jgi:hypothetical protein
LLRKIFYWGLVWGALDPARQSEFGVPAWRWPISGALARAPARQPICVASGGDVERAKFSRNALNGAGANANLSGDFQNALAGPQLSLDSFFQRLIDLRAAELLALFYGPPISAQMRSSGLFVAMWFGEQIN